VNVCSIDCYPRFENTPVGRLGEGARLRATGELRFDLTSLQHHGISSSARWSIPVKKLLRLVHCFSHAKLT
jgi:hypothetical protein